MYTPSTEKELSLSRSLVGSRRTKEAVDKMAVTSDVWKETNVSLSAENGWTQRSQHVYIA